MIFVRETGSAPHYAIRICKKLIDNEKRVTLYGQVERLKKIDILRHEKVKFIEQNEKALINYIFPDFKVDDNITFNSGFSVKPYFDQCNIIESRMPLFKVALEGTRGCEFKCKFCYINCNNQEIVQKWDVRSIRSILQDISIYYNLGFRLFVFMDSEFIGRSRARDNEIKELSENIKEMFPDIRFMIYARADTISKCTALENLKDAGLINIFIGVESFFQNNLTNLKKRD
ncbi:MULTISPECIES: radical SAM protein [unclassified Moraxella]|uniref:radical SAM protein n=1 Tax=unclassified Moraxella TaxID=2685852 RepID=UPI00359EAA55